MTQNKSKANLLKNFIFSLFRKGYCGAKQMFVRGERSDQNRKNHAIMRGLITFISPCLRKVTLRKSEEIFGFVPLSETVIRDFGFDSWRRGSPPDADCLGRLDQKRRIDAFQLALFHPKGRSPDIQPIGARPGQ